MRADGEGDAHVTSTVVTVILVHRHGGSSSRLQGPLTVPSRGSGPKEYCGRHPTARRVAPSRSPGKPELRRTDTSLVTRSVTIARQRGPRIAIGAANSTARRPPVITVMKVRRASGYVLRELRWANSMAG